MIGKKNTSETMSSREDRDETVTTGGHDQKKEKKKKKIQRNNGRARKYTKNQLRNMFAA